MAKTEYEVTVLQRWMDNTRTLEESTAIKLRDEIHNAKEETRSERRRLVLQKLRFAEALCRWQEELEVEMEECEVGSVSQEYVKALQGSWRSIEELLNSGWLPNTGSSIL